MGEKSQSSIRSRIGKGTLAKEKFIYYMKQDYVYLIDYAKLFAVGAVKANDLETMGKFAQILHETLHVEMELHRHLQRSLVLHERN